MTFVTTSPVHGALSNAWAIQSPRDQGIPIDSTLGIACAKTFLEKIGLTYSCVAEVGHLQS